MRITNDLAADDHEIEERFVRSMGADGRIHGEGRLRWSSGSTSIGRLSLRTFRAVESARRPPRDRPWRSRRRQPAVSLSGAQSRGGASAIAPAAAGGKLANHRTGLVKGNEVQALAKARK